MTLKSGQPLWLSGDIAAAIGAVSRCPPDLPIAGVSIDSRTVGEGHLFFAIKGDRFDGHRFVDGALESGAALAVVSHEKRGEVKSADDRLLVVDDVLKAMEDLGRAARARLGGNVVAVTGSVGKTGTKEMLRMALAASGKVHASVASFNNHWGVPLTLCRTETDNRFGVYEIGMNHPGEIVPLVGMVRPHVAIITTVEPVHLEFFDNEQEIARAKAEIFTGLEPGGTALINRDNRHFEFLTDLAKEAGVQLATFGEAGGADVALLDVELLETSSKVTARVFGETYHYVLGAPGRHIVQNSLAVAGALHLMGANVAAGLEALSGLAAPKGRGARMDLEIDGGHITLLDESYNANPASMRAALGLLGTTEPSEKGRRIAVLGDMLELGEESDSLHAGLKDAVLAAKTDAVFLSGPHMAALNTAIPDGIYKFYAETAAGLEETLLSAVAQGDVVMVKGSLGSKMGPLVEALVKKCAPNSP